MNSQDLFELYKKLYFFEMERREKIASRLALPFAVLVAIAGFLSFMLNSTAYPEGVWRWVFWGLFAAACISAAIGAWFFRGSWFGHTDKLLPTAYDTEQYRLEMVDLYKDFDNRDELVSIGLRQYFYDYYMRFSSENAINNDKRSFDLYRATVALTISVVFSFLAFLPFYFGK